MLISISCIFLNHPDRISVSGRAHSAALLLVRLNESI